jgi:ATP-dependent helicase HrpA
VRRLVSIATRGVLANAAQRIPAPLPKLDGSPVSRAETDAFRGMVLARVVEDAFGIGPDAELPRSREAFEKTVREGAPKVDATARRYADVLEATAAELAKTLQAMRAASKHPSGTGAMKEMRAQLEQLFPPTLLEHCPPARLAHFPRYLKAVQVRLGRAVDNPQKDAGKLEPFAPVWAAFLAKFAGARDREAAWALRWSFEELRVSIFAPELTTPVSVSLAKVAAAVTALR